ncbi:hypothetical protein P691DRAFT_170301 [Macrolepiota fuliginosa MF-IS2]|uniref:DUF6533 domain-containing protein n=1 Tax=Macrolepiota fuliginosa MF-IS2 TaxID=1400762 RepID=A0A9P5XAE1_9AGAR|nr:hypothetical protein P691DRAFT_170301 [Macrolepiota fuliginosa MF-IS2]
MVLNAAATLQESGRIVVLTYRQQVDQYFSIASVAYWLYEYFLTIIPEISLIWSSQWTPIKVLYFLTRYSPLIDSGLAIPAYVISNATTRMCMNLYITHTIFLYVGIIFAEVMLVYRVWVVWQRGKWIGIGLFAFSVTSIGAATGLTLAVVSSFKVAPPHPPLGCTVIADISSLQIASLVFTLGYALVLAVLMAVQYIHTHREGPYGGAFVRATQLDGLVPYLFLLFSVQWSLCVAY